ncbi:Dual specificity protein phosphatase 12 [Folsomia candida]|uniref:Dual specificity protein phosphatase 12 n=1 Tax=Folsomia candida TaxID=158441 RepID=A0A226EX64_FOLCA|nr:Dual specificity protein phosphatase 12 [Folsomia candida]
MINCFYFRISGNLAAACDIHLLKKYRISHILTIDSCPLPSKIQDLPQVTTKFLKVSDMPREDILQYFDDTNEFIDSALRLKKRVLVHCYYGVSRSATLVLAYLMQKYRLSLEEAQNRLEQRRSVVGPNYGFLSQLKLYEVMEYKIQKKNLFFKRFRLHVASDKLKAAKVLSTPYKDVIKPDPALLCVSPEPVVYQCRRCRRILACATNILPHTEGKAPIWSDFPRPQLDNSQQLDESVATGAGPSDAEGESEGESSGGAGSGPPPLQQHLILPPPPICTQMLFIEPLAWMTDVTQNLQGKLHCPNANCKSKLGSFSWVMGCLCPCGAKVQPAFYLVPSKVDRSTSVLNIQITI